MAGKKEEEIKKKLTISDDYLCSKCEIPGHLEEDCDVPDSIFSLGTDKRMMKCEMCGKEGHEEKNCM